MVGTRFVSVGEARIHVRESGEPGLLPSAVALHGIGRTLQDWEPQHDRIGVGRRMISMDLPGFGFSDRLPGPTTLPSLADGVLATLDALGETGPVHLLGNSLGGAVALRMLACRPASVRSLVLVNSAGFGREVTIGLRLLAVPGLGKVLLRPSRGSTRRAEQALFGDPAFATEERVDHSLAVANRPGTTATFLEAGRELGTLRGVRAGWRTTLLDEVAAHPRPTLILWGDRDRVLPPHHLRAARALLPHAQTHVYGGVGHMPQIERADEVARLVGAFLARHDSDDAAQRTPEPRPHSRSA
ncbi:alpha/beta fold hydrolase [Pseudonocardia humida]|uniref:Alpha/beta fold hydrolase n=1 Tax=Pseudonocardia humida TaxID=2800819 RepID=A0ABT1ADJ3_9PSEU|nr:alpha/beta fold hydrolase [Pseudonocardia humida]MCO1661142.1 alpha/beta fold hydrolase [Pseudonocardia humida]